MGPGLVSASQRPSGDRPPPGGSFAPECVHSTVVQAPESNGPSHAVQRGAAPPSQKAPVSPISEPVAHLPAPLPKSPQLGSPSVVFGRAGLYRMLTPPSLLWSRRKIRRARCRSESGGRLRLRGGGGGGWSTRAICGGGRGREGRCGDCGVGSRGILRATGLVSGPRWSHEAGAAPLLRGDPIVRSQRPVGLPMAAVSSRWM